MIGVYARVLEAFDLGHHVFPAEKYRELARILEGRGWRLLPVEEPASFEDLLLVHTPAYIDDLRHARWTPRTRFSEIPLNQAIVEAFRYMAAGTLLAAEQALEHGGCLHIGGGFHHAYPDHAEGFCYVNDLAYAIRRLQREGLIRRAAVVDLDVHQGNGTAAIFQGDPDVFTFSMHQEDLYPVPKEKSDLDVGFFRGAGDEVYLETLARHLPRVWAFEPDLVLYQAGVDPYEEDVLGGLALSARALRERDRMVIRGALEHRIPVVITLGGGYARNPRDTVRLHLQTAEVLEEALGGLTTSGSVPIYNLNGKTGVVE